MKFKYQIPFLIFIISSIPSLQIAAQDVGIGTSSPDYRLHITDADSSLLKLENSTDLNTNIRASLFFKTGSWYTGGIKTIGTNFETARLGFFTYAWSTASGLKESLSILDNGYVGIDKINPAFKLDVRNGSINTDSVYRIGTKKVLAARTDLKSIYIGEQSGGTYQGFFNTFCGFQSGFLNVGYYNAFFGYKTGSANYSGDGNAFFGYETGKLNTYGDDNSFFGYLAGEENTIGFQNAFFGSASGRSNISGGLNSFFGSNAGVFNKGSINSFFGHNAGYLNNEGNWNCFLGGRSGYSNTSGSQNTTVGYHADVSTGILTNASAIGSNAQVNCSNCMVLGSVNGVNLAQATVKVGIGVNSPFFRLDVRNGSINTDSVYRITASTVLAIPGLGNLFLGKEAGKNLAGGTHNTFTGLQAGYSINAGQWNVFSGYRAGYNNENGLGNTFIGTYSGENNENGHFNTTLGHGAEVNGINQDNATAIGSFARVDCENCMVLGSVNGINGATSNVNVGIGINAPDYPLTFAPTTGDKISLYSDASSSYGFGIAGSLLQIHTSVAAADIAFGYGDSGAFTERMRIRGNGNVGIGLTLPLRPLSFAALLGKKISLYPGGTGDAGFGVFNAELRMHSDHSGADITFGYDDYALGFTEQMRIKGNGNVGIGTNAPGYILDVDGRMRIRSGGTNGTSAGLWFNSNANIPRAFLGMENDDYIGIYGSAGFQFKMNATNGNVSIGVGDPTEKLTVHGNIRANGNICYTGTNGACSDIRYKTNLSPLTLSLDKVQQMQGFYYFWKQEGFKENGFNQERQIGFSAQEVEVLFPEIVQTDASGYKSVDYGRLTPVLVEAIKEQQLQIENQQQQIDDLKKVVEELIQKN